MVAIWHHYMSYKSASSSEQSLISKGRILVSVCFIFLLYVIGGNNLQAANFNSDIRSLTLAGTAGLVSDFDNSLSYDWRIAKATLRIVGFDAAAFDLLLAGYSNGLGGGAFGLRLANGDKDLLLSFASAPVPEASSYVLMGFGLLILGCAWRRRRV